MSNDITVKIKADGRDLKRGMDRASVSVKDFSAEAHRMSVNVAKAGAVVVTAVAAIGAGVLKMASEAAKAGVEVRNLAAVAGTSTTNFQRMADASRTVGVEQEKLSDILKDVNDKFGDYMATGAGPLADFFENIAPKIGVTADQFANLAGPDALQLYVDSLEKAGVSQQQMTFYMEALASDTTRLIPLLRNGGAEMARLGDEAQRAGRIMDEGMIAKAVELDRELANLSNTLKVQATAAVLEYKDEIIGLINFITDTLIPSIGGFLKWVDDGVKGWQELGRAAQLAGQYIAIAAETQRNSNLVGGTGPGVGDMPNPDDLFGGGSDTSTLTPESVLGGLDTRPSQGPFTPEGWAPMTSGTPLDAEGGLLPEQSPLDAARAAWEATQELQEEIETGTAEHADRLVEIARRQAEEEARIRQDAARREMQIRSQTIDSAIGLLGNLGKENEKFAKAAVALNAAKAIGETIQNTAAASVRALAELGPIAGPPAAARIKAYGAIQAGIIGANALLQIRGGGGRSGGGGGGSPSGIAQGGGQEQGGGGITQNRSLTLIGDNYNRKQAIDIAEYMNEGTDNGLIIRGRG